MSATPLVNRNDNCAQSSKTGVFINLHVLLWKRISDTAELQTSKFKNENQSCFTNIYKDFNNKNS